MTETCGGVPPRSEHEMENRDGSVSECILPRSHNGTDTHLLRRDDGSYIAWGRDWECTCTTCEAGEHDYCFTYELLSDEEAQRIIEGAET